MLDGFLEAIVRALRKGEAVKIVDFGTFQVTRRRTRPGHNPHTGQPMKIAGRRWPRFAAGKGLRRAVAEGRPRGGAPAVAGPPAAPAARRTRPRKAVGESAIPPALSPETPPPAKTKTRADEERG